MTGLIGVLHQRRLVFGADTPPVMLLAPQQISNWLNFYDKRIETISNDYTLIYNSDLVRN